MEYVTKWDCLNGGQAVPGLATLCNTNRDDDVVYCCDNDHLCNRNRILVLPMETINLPQPTSTTKAIHTSASGMYVAEDIIGIGSMSSRSRKS